MPGGRTLGRRQFVRLAAGAAGAAALGGLPALASCGDSQAPGDPEARSPLARAAELSSAGAVLTAAPGSAAIADGQSSAGWLFNGGLPGPTIRARRNGALTLQLRNQLPDPTIVHWHGLVVPEHADGHPRDAIAAGAAYDYEFPIVQRAGTFWYHPHAHHRTAEQVHRGLAGFFIVSDEEEDTLGLPAGADEILLLLQDRDGDPATALAYAPDAADLHGGMLRGVPFGNGVRLPALEVEGRRYRFRVVNASHARVYRLAFDTGAPLTVIGNDGGLLPAPSTVASVDLGVGERIDFLVDFAEVPAGRRLMLRSLPFTLPAAGERWPQGMPMNVLELVRRGEPGTPAPALPAVLSSVVPLGAAAAERTFVFRSTGDAAMHRINDVSFDMERVDVEIPLGQVEHWRFVNDSTLPHPVHLHGTHFQVAARTGGRGAVLPWEAGWKDTVLVLPLEAVEVLVRFDAYQGIFLLHCHNLQHEDEGMMLNVAVT
jgi:FtsP/CotA-like multicopper oxidase with cupredoxin domain